MRVARFSALAAVAGAAAFLMPSLGLSHSSPVAKRAQQACGNRVEYVSGLEAVFGRRKTQQQALAFRTQVVARGFVNANIIEGCDGFRVVVRGIDTFDIGVDQGPAKPADCHASKNNGFLNPGRNLGPARY